VLEEPPAPDGSSDKASDEDPPASETPDDPEEEEDEEDDPVAGLDKRLGEIEDRLGGYPTLEVGGRIHADYWGFPVDSPGIGFFENPASGADPESRFLFRRIRLEIEGDINDTMNYRLQVDFNNPGTPEIKDVWIGLKELPGNQSLLVGYHKRPLGMDHLNSSRFNVFLERPLVVEAFNEDARRPGIAMWGHSDDESVGWAYGAYLLENIAADGQAIGDAVQPSLNGRYWGSPWYDECSGGRGYLHLGIAGMVAQPDGSPAATDSNTNAARFRTRPEGRSSSRWIDTGPIAGARYYEVLAAEAMLNVGSLEITAEAQTNWVQRDNFTPGSGDDLFFHGAYVHMGYFLTGEHTPYNRTTGMIGRTKPFENFFLVERCCDGVGGGWGAWQVAARLDYLDLTSQDVRGGREYDASLAVNWHWNPNTKLQFNLIYGDIDEHRPQGGFTDGHFLIVGTRFAADF
jgi:phosphate-selective porin OprO and OprP